MDVRYDILELTRFLTELSVIDYYFVGQKPSAVALAALLNAMTLMPAVSDAAIDDLKRELKRLPALDPNNHEVEDCRSRLRVLYEQGAYERQETLGDTEPRHDTNSPVCVSFGVCAQVPTCQNEMLRSVNSVGVNQSIDKPCGEPNFQANGLIVTNEIPSN